MSLIPFAYSINKKELVDVSNVPGGKKCNCLCPSCDMNLIARKGDKNEHHFAHKDKAITECEYSYWVSIRDMAKQIILNTNHINIHSYNAEKLHKNIFTNTDGTIEVFKAKNYTGENFDFTLNTSIGIMYVYFITLEESSLFRNDKHESNRDDYFTTKIILSVDLSNLANIKNNFKNNLKDIIIDSTLHKKILKPTCSFYEEEISEDEEIESSKYIGYSEKTEIKKDIPLYKLLHVKDEKILYLLNLQNKKLNKKDIRTINTMKNFYLLHTNYNRDEELSENLVILNEGNNLTFISCKNNLYGLAHIEEGSFVYQVYEDKIVYIDKGKSLEEVEQKINMYILEQNNSF